MIGLKVSKAIGIINDLKSIYPQRVLFTLYNSLIISHMLYGITYGMICPYGANQIMLTKLLNYKREPYARYPSVDQLHILNHCSKHSMFEI